MGRAIVRQPQAFLMDEPLSNLDAQLRVQTRAEIHRLQRELGITTVYVTHDQVEAMTMGDRVAVMRDGVLQQIDTPQYVYDHPANRFVAGFIGSPAMNLVEGRLSAVGHDLVVSFGEHALLVGRRPGLRRYLGRNVVVGLRPEDFEDARLMSEGWTGSRIRTRCAVREALGSDILVHFNLEGRDQARAATYIARLSPRAHAREGEQVELAVEADRLHFFDPATGLVIDEGPRGA
jgi:multiple sugar transport system ATP-binding protein